MSDSRMLAYITRLSASVGSYNATVKEKGNLNWAITIDIENSYKQFSKTVFAHTVHIILLMDKENKQVNTLAWHGGAHMQSQRHEAQAI